MRDDVEKFVRLSPNVWPGEELDVQPGDLTQFAPMGSGLGGPPVMMPWDTLESAMGRGNYYSFHGHSGHPLGGAPITEAAGGVVYFDDRIERADFDALLRVLEVRGSMKDFVAFYGESRDPRREHYLDQLRFMRTGAVKIFGASPTLDGQEIPEQALSLGEAMWKFLEHEREYFGGGYSEKLDGCLGGDGDWAKESLCFGLFVENSYHGIYRLWSRAWLVTK